MTTSGEGYGRLHMRSSRRRHIDTWTFASPFHDQTAREAGYEAKVYLYNGGPDRSVRLRAESKHFEALEHSDIKQLFELVESAFQLTDMKSREVIWEDWIELELPEGVYFRDEFGCSVIIKWSYLKRGVHPATGKVYTINNNGVVVPFPQPKAAGAHDPSDGKSWSPSRDFDTQYSYIPATPANVAALQNLEQRTGELRERLRGLLTQEQAQLSLASEILLLPKGTP